MVASCALGWVCVVYRHLVSVRTFGVTYDHIFLNLQITKSDIRPHIKWAELWGQMHVLDVCTKVNMVQGQQDSPLT